MSEPAGGDLPKLAEDIAVLAIKVVGDVAGDPATFVQKVLDRPDVQQQLTKELEALAKKLHEQASGKLPRESAEEVGTALVKKAGDALKDGALEEIKKTPAAKELTKKVDEFTGALKKTPVGVWFDKNSTTIYLIAGGAALAGAVTMYAVQAGDVVTDTVLPMLDNKKVKVKEFEFGVTSLRFKPSDREVELKGFATGTWKKLTVRVNLMGKAIGPHVEAASADVNAKVVTGPWTFSATGKAAMTGDGKLGLGVTYTKEGLKIDVLADITRQTALANGAGSPTPAIPGYGLGAKGGVGYQGKIGDAPFNVGVQGNVGTAPGTGLQYGVLGTFSVTLDPVKKKK
jgi:hypothetical protein